MSVEVLPNIPPPPPTRGKPKLKKLRLLAILIPLSLLALVSTVFGMMMAVASDLPDLDTAREFRSARNTVLLDAHNKPMGLLTSPTNRVIVDYGQIAPVMRSAIIAIEDRRFYDHSGVDLKAIARAVVQDVVQQRAAQGGSTISQQFVKNALQAQAKRTVFQKLREAALAYHLTRKWSKEKILTQYLNSIYFGNGAYGIESAARTYFGQDINHKGCGIPERRCAAGIQPHEAALLAGIVSSPSAYDPVAHPVAAKRRRDLVIDKMVEQGRLPAAQGAAAKAEGLPGDVRPPVLRTRAPYFSTWVRQHLVERFGVQRAFEGGLRVQTTLDLELQDLAVGAVNRWLGNSSGPSAAMVVIDNATGQVRAMVGGRDYNSQPFNLATHGQRQPGSSFKPFILAEALRQGLGPGSLWPSRKREFTVPGTGGREKFVVNNFEDNYSGTTTLANALTQSDNSVYAAVGIRIGTRKVARLARRMGIRTPVSSNYAMTLGGLSQGVTPLDMAHAYETIATGGEKVTGSLAAGRNGPVGIREVRDSRKKIIKDGANKTKGIRVIDPGIAQLQKQIMATVVTSGTGKRAAIGQFAAGKTGTTENYGDAWFVGFTDRFTAAVWVGYPYGLRPMKSEFQGEEVTGGTFPALIWHDFMLQAMKVMEDRAAKRRAKLGLPPKEGTDTTTTPTTTAPGDSGGTEAPGATPEDGGEPPGGPGPAEPAPRQRPKAAPAPTPAPQAAPPAGGGGGTGGAQPPPG
jgi:penicillin-binding protein 1A